MVKNFNEWLEKKKIISSYISLEFYCSICENTFCDGELCCYSCDNSIGDNSYSNDEIYCYGEEHFCCESCLEDYFNDEVDDDE